MQGSIFRESRINFYFFGFIFDQQLHKIEVSQRSLLMIFFLHGSGWSRLRNLPIAIYIVGSDRNRAHNHAIIS